MSETIPFLDLAGLYIPENLEGFDAFSDLDSANLVVKGLANDIVKAFTETGFVYLLNHKVSHKSLDRFNEKTAEFFALPIDIKSKYRRSTSEDPSGWFGHEDEGLNENSKAADFKEVYNFTPKTIKMWPDEVPGLKETVLDVVNVSTRLCHIVLKLIGIGLQLEDPNYFIKANSVTERSNLTTIRAAYYEPVPKKMAQQPGLLRCGEHSDYGSVTLLYQDNVGGLEVMNRDGVYVAANPVEGAVIVNIADMMQRWTADRLVSTKHRVIVPKEEYELQSTRRSIAFFAMPDNEAVIRCIDDSDKYPPISPLEYVIEKMSKTTTPVPN